MAEAKHRRQIGLFLAAVVLPSAVLTVLGLRMMTQERQLAAGRVADDRRRVAAEIRQSLLVELERVERHALTALSESEGPLPPDHVDAVLAFAAPVLDDRIALPWERDPTLAAVRAALAEAAFAGAIRGAEMIELRDRDYPAAIRSYRSIIKSATHESQESLGRLLLARALMGSGSRDMAEEEYRALIARPSAVVDEHGVPFAWYAAAALSDLGRDPEAVRDRLATDVVATGWRTPIALYMLRDLLSRVSVSLPDSNGRAVDGGDRVAAEIRLVERVQGLQRALSFFQQTVDDGGTGASSDWIPFAEGEWLVRVTRDGAGSSVLIAADVEAAFRRVWESDAHLDDLTGPFELRFGLESDMEPLGESLPGFGLAFLASPETVMTRQLGARNSLYLLALVVVVGITLFGGYLLMRDIRREMRIVRMRSDFVSSVSHELKTPLTAIRMFAETLRMRERPEPAVQAECLDTIVGESERLTRLLNNVLDVSRIERGQKGYRREPTSLGEIAERAARALEYPLRRDGFRLNTSLENGLPPLPVDGDAIEQAILNLLTNAMKYSGDSREIDLRLRREDGYAVVDVTDHGVGIPEDARDRVTEKFFRVPSPENESIPGSGLGLTIVEHAVRAHGGCLKVKSAVGEGSTFSIRLPLMDPEVMP